MKQGELNRQRLRVVIRGAVQGVGFRPFIFRLAERFSLYGWVNNTAQGVFIEVEGSEEALTDFLLCIEREKPSAAFIQSLEAVWLDTVNFSQFEIIHSDDTGPRLAFILPDMATCPECLSDIRDPLNRRYRYPFTNCTLCGPRFTIINSLPYDRPNTVMNNFPMCRQCREEYEDPRDRRFHAQPTACPNCGPKISLWDSQGITIAIDDAAMRATTEAIRMGKIIAFKGLGGYQLICDARRQDTVLELRKRKHREEKPFALLVPSLEEAQRLCELSEKEIRLFCSPERPITLLRRKQEIGLATSLFGVSGYCSNPYLGLMLPCTPLHYLLMDELDFPVVATSGNLSDETICIDNGEALSRLSGIADLFLTHDRPIARHADDSVARVMLGREMIVRRARGYAPLPVKLPHETAPLLAVGAHMKNAVAIGTNGQAFISQHIGDLETEAAFTAFQQVSKDLCRLYDMTPAAIVCDMHPDYLSTRYAQSSGLPVVSVQHHVAHAFSCMVENEIAPPALGVVWDGTGFGTDGTIWGGEFIRITPIGYERAARFRPFRLAGGDSAVKEPARSALGLLAETFDNLRPPDSLTVNALSENSLPTLWTMIQRGINSPWTSSAGRLFDGIASLAGVRQITRHEGQAAMDLEFLLEGITTDESYQIELMEGADGLMVADWSPMVKQVLVDVRDGVTPPLISARFHNAMVNIILAVALQAGEEAVVLSGGCFQNKYLTEQTVTRLKEAGFHPYWHQRVPPNDGGIALGQLGYMTIINREK